MDPLEPPSQPQGQGSFVRPLFISLSIVVCISLLLVAYHLLLVKYCISRRRRRRSMSNNSFTIPLQRSEMRFGVEEHVLKAIPVILFSKNNIKLQAKLDHDQTECVICLGELEDGDKVRSLPNCGHVFHVPCIDDWLSAHTNCPICRAPIVSSPVVPGSPIDHRIASVLQESSSTNIHTREITTQNLAQFLEQGDEDGTSFTSTSNKNPSSTTTSLQSSRKLFHSLSLVLPMEGKQQSFMKLKRSLSMDQCFVIIDIERENDQEKAAASSSSSSTSSSSCSSPYNNSCSLKDILMESRSYKAKSMKQLDRVSSRLLSSFSQIRFGESDMTTRERLPC